MAIMRWNGRLSPWFGLNRPSSEMDRLFGDDGEFFGISRRSHPAVNVCEEPESWILSFAIPGVDPKDVDLSIKDGILTLKGKKTCRTSSEEGRVHRRESCLSECEFSRSMSLPENVDTETIEADISNGVLTVTLKKAEKAKERRIEIHPRIENDKNS